MHAVFVSCFVGGAVATALFLVLGVVGGAFAHGVHAHAAVGAHGHAHAGHGHTSPGGSPSGHAHATTSGSHAGSGHAHTSHGTGAREGVAAQHAVPSQTGGPHWLGTSAGWALSWLSPLTIAAALVCFGGAGIVVGSNSLVLPIAVVAAVLGAILIRSVMNAFVSASVPPLSLTGDGAIGTVNSQILPHSTGEVLYTLEGLHRSMPARSTTGEVLPRGTEVVITRREKGIAWVERLDGLLDGSEIDQSSAASVSRQGSMSSRET